MSPRAGLRQPRQAQKLRAPRKRANPRIYLRARKLYRPKKPALPDAGLIAGLNRAETRVYLALVELGIRFTAQTAFGGGNILGGARADFLLHDYGIDLEYQGPFHATTEGSARDLLRNQLVQKQGYRIVPLYERDLPRLKARILEVVGRPIGAVL